MVRMLKRKEDKEDEDDSDEDEDNDKGGPFELPIVKAEKAAACCSCLRGWRMMMMRIKRRKMNLKKMLWRSHWPRGESACKSCSCEAKSVTRRRMKVMMVTVMKRRRKKTRSLSRQLLENKRRK